jgi:uncharacterized protein YndB with AHSA1/START domain
MGLMQAYYCRAIHYLGSLDMASNTVRLHRVLRAPPERIYRAFLDVSAIVKWLPPNGFTCTVHELEAKVGGRYRMSFKNFSTGHGHSFGGEYLELVSNERLRYTGVFEDQHLAGAMQTTVELRAVFFGAEMSARLFLMLRAF